MSGCSSSGSTSDNSFDIEELLEIGTRCRELRKEKDMLRESKSQSFDLIRRLELHVKSLSEARTEDKKRIDELERELGNCYQEIDYLQDQLNLRNTEVNCLGEHVHSLELKLVAMESLEEKVGRLGEELQRSSSELENKEFELQESTLCIEKLQESISSAALEYHCEIESMKLDLLALENSCLEAKKIQEETALENIRFNGLIHDFEVRIHESQKVIECLDEENKELREKLEASERNARIFRQQLAEQFEELLDIKDKALLDTQSPLSEQERDTSNCGSTVGSLPSRLVAVGAADEDLKEKMKKMSHQIHEYELLVKQLKEELREEKLKAKEEAEDLAQEMAELRYQISGLLEEECKRRACVEQISLQRIAQLEAQIEKEQRKSFISVRDVHEA